MASKLEVALQVPFRDICMLLEKIHEIKGTDKKKNMLNSFIASWRDTHHKIHGNTQTEDSFFPAMRLLLPQFDKERPAYGLKEVALAKHYIEILSIGKESMDAKKLLNYKAPNHASKNAGDFATVAYFVLVNRCPEKGSLNIKQVNDLLTKLAMGNSERKKSEMRNALQSLLRNTSALEQKWLIRIILKELKGGISDKSVFDVFHPDAMELYNVCSSLSKVCEDLRDPTVRTSDTDIKLFSAFKPMLGQRAAIDEVEKLMNVDEFYIETKLDGERFMLHREENTFKYFSRGSNDYTATFGASPKEGYLTPFIADCFPSKVKSCILDGEMMAFDASNKAKFLSKGENIDFKSAKTYSSNAGLHPCFVVFDVIFVNGKSIASLPLKERLQNLEKIFTAVPGRIERVQREQASKRQDVIVALNNAVDKYEEGLLIKSPSSIYQPNIRNGSGWLKIKPEYVNGLADELDVIIIGGYFGSGSRGGMISHFLCGVSCPSSIHDEEAAKFYSFCKVGSGYTNKELKDLSHHLDPYWRKFDAKKPPTMIEFTNGFKEKPDVWIEPRNSKIVQVKAAEIVPSDNYKTGQTLRFPRVEKIRDDKTWNECLDINELERIRTIAKGKLTYQHATTSDEHVTKKNKRIVTRIESPLKVAKHFAAANTSNVEEKSRIFEGKEFYIVNGPPDCGKVELEGKILENGGKVVQNPGKDTHCVIAHKSNVRVTNIIKQTIYDIVNASWLLESLERKQMVPWLPCHMIHMSSKTIEKFSLEYDENGDSFTKDLNVETLKEIFKKLDERQNVVKLTRNDIIEVEERYITNSTLGLFRSYRFYVDRYSTIGDPHTRLPSSSLHVQTYVLRYYGGHISDTFDEEVSHVITSPRDFSRVPVIQQIMHRRTRFAHIVTETWITECVQVGAILKEQDYRPIIDDVLE
ncbi:DNA ligase 4-like isoform X2 [Xenia sp. Carnegie-2017]|uniref:DNA ligase 4-like isoform X2 n=1 Tax=Xenia sp. Carnegie-2017 TaxID=2897299 RepID=UPI001F04E9B0|nr:DNA ligase 4-like isoform X2 [Xenia sp. Carnegie-2017]